MFQTARKEGTITKYLATWLYRYGLAQSIIGIGIGILNFAGIFTLVLGPTLFGLFGFGYFQTFFFLLGSVAAIIFGTGFVLDRIVRFWSAQAQVATVRNPWLFDRLYEKEALTIANQHLPVMRALRELVKDPERKVELDRSIARLEQTVRDGKWTVSDDEDIYNE